MSIHPHDRTLSLLALPLIVWLVLVDTSASAKDRDAGPAMATAENPNDMVAETEDPDDMRAETEDPGDMVVGTEDPDDMVTGTEDPDDMVAETEDPDTMTTRSYRLRDLPRANDRSGASGSRTDRSGRPEKQNDRRVQSYTPTHRRAGSGDGEGPSKLTAELAEARARLDHAMRERDRWDAEYSRSVTNGRVRGEARGKIVSAREEATKEVESAREQLHALAGEARRAGVNPMVIDGFVGSL